MKTLIAVAVVWIAVAGAAEETVAPQVSTASVVDSSAPAVAPAAPTPLPEPKPEPKAVSAKTAEPTKNPSPDEEWTFAKSAAEDSDLAIQEAAIDELNLFVRRFPDATQAPEALATLASLRAAKGEWPSALVTLLRAIHEYPESKGALRAKSSYLELVDKKASRRQRQPLNDLVAVADSGGKADRLAALWQQAAVKAPDAFYGPLAEEIRSFEVRFPNHADGDKLQAALARVHSANVKPAAAALAWRKLLTLYPGSALRAVALKSLGDLYYEALRDPKKAIDAYQDLIANYPQASEVLAAYENSARLFEEKLKQYDLAVEMDDKIAKGFPKTAGSLKALKAIARLQRERLAKPDAAVKTLQRLSAMHAGQEGVDALLLAAEIARKDLKDYKLEATLRQQVAADYPSSKEAAEALAQLASAFDIAADDPKVRAKLLKGAKRRR